jgi:hypothetical protein
MCELCQKESEDEYSGDSIAEKRKKLVHSIIERHPELGIETSQVVYRFAPRAERHCIRVNVASDGPKYEIHVPSYTALAMSSPPLLSRIAMIAAVETGDPFDEVTKILDYDGHLDHDALFISKRPPINPARDKLTALEYEDELKDKYRNKE